MASKKRSVKRQDQIEGSKLSYNVSEQEHYSSEMRSLFSKLIDETEKQVYALFRKDATKDYIEEFNKVEDASVTSEFTRIFNRLTKFFNPFFSKKAQEMAERMVNQTLKYSKSSLNFSLNDAAEGVSINVKEMSPVLREIIKASVKENVGLITSLQKSYLDDVNKTVNRAITQGQGLKDIQEYLGGKLGESNQVPLNEKVLRHAKNMALDQTRKVYNNVNAERMKSSGIKKFIWLHSGGGQHPRPDHVAMNGKEYSFDDLPVIDRNTGERGIPGQAINCKCTMKPVIDFGD